MDALKAMWETVPAATSDDLAGARRRLLDGMRTRRPVAAVPRPRRVVTLPRLLVAAGVAAAVSVTPLVVGSGPPAYAVTEGSDGTIEVTLNELRDPDGLEEALADAGVQADVTFLAPRTRCETPRFAGVDGAYGGAPLTQAELKKAVGEWRSTKVAKPIDSRTIGIHPEHIRPGETLVLEFRDNQNPSVPWTLGAWLAESGTPVKPCTPVVGNN